MRKYLLFLLVFILTGCSDIKEAIEEVIIEYNTTYLDYKLDKIPVYEGEPYIELNNNIPLFKDDEMIIESFETYSELDILGRCSVAYANVSIDTMPKEEREEIGSVKPAGYQAKRYDKYISDRYLYNRCHLIGFQLTGENANKNNLITGTRYLNVEGMLPFENQVAKYVKETNNHVLYRVTPIYVENELLCRGLTIEAYSVEDEGEGICFYVYCFNNQPYIELDYMTGDSKLDLNSLPKSTYVINSETKKFHTKDCSSVDFIKEENLMIVESHKDVLIESGYEPCGKCLSE